MQPVGGNVPQGGNFAQGGVQQGTAMGSGMQPGVTPAYGSQQTTASGAGAFTGAQGAPGAMTVATEYRAQQEQLFYLSEKMLSFGKDDFNIKDMSGHTVFKVDAALLSIKGARALTDAQKHTILTMQHKIIGSGTWEIYRGNGSTNEKLAVVKKAHGIGKLLAGTTHPGPVVNVHLGHMTTLGAPDIVVMGDVMGKGYSILQHNSMIAEVSRALANTSRFRLGGKDAYAVRVMPGCDCAFMLALAVVIDELFHD